MMASLWPHSWRLLLLIIPVEAMIAKWIIRIDFKKALELSAAVNIASTVIGLPLLWLGLTAIVVVSVYKLQENAFWSSLLVIIGTILFGGYTDVHDATGIT
jgi:hypothetical protein